MLNFFLQNKLSAGRFTVCEDFGRLNHPKCEAPQSLQAKREPNPSGANWKYAESDFSRLTKKSTLTLSNNFLFILGDFLRQVYKNIGRCAHLVKARPFVS